MIAFAPVLIVLRVLSQTVLLALAQIWSNKIRTVLTTLGIIVAVASIIIVMGGLRGMKQGVLNEFESFGVKRVWMDGNLPRSMRGKYRWQDVQLTAAELEAVRRHAGSIEMLTGMYFGSYAIQNGEIIIEGIATMGIEPSWHDIASREVIQGRRFVPVDIEQRRNVCIINEKAIDELSLPKEPVGEFLLVSGRRFLVAGVVENEQASMFDNRDARTEVYIPITTAMNLNPEGWINFAQGQITDAKLADEAVAEITFVLRNMRGLEPDEENTFDVQVMQKFLESFNSVAVGITAATFVVVFVSLVVGGIGIMNIMLVSVSERTREIGLRKSVGAHPMVILTQFLVEAVVLCLAGSLVGIAVGQLALLGIRSLPFEQVENLAKEAVAPLWALVLSAGLSAAAGIGFGMFPAIRAAMLNPIDALRHE